MFNTGSITGEVIKNYSSGGVNTSDTFDLIYSIPINTGSLSSSGSVESELILKQINENLQFQNDLLIFFIGFFTMFFALILSFPIFIKLKKSYFFTK